VHYPTVQAVLHEEDRGTLEDYLGIQVRSMLQEEVLVDQDHDKVVTSGGSFASEQLAQEIRLSPSEIRWPTYEAYR